MAKPPALEERMAQALKVADLGARLQGARSPPHLEDVPAVQPVPQLQQVAPEPTPEVAPKPRSPRARSPRGEAAPAAELQRHGRLPVGSWNVRPENIRAVRTAAGRRANVRGYGKADQSEIVREALDMWMEAHPEEWEE